MGMALPRRGLRVSSIYGVVEINYLSITRRIRACESEVPAQLVLEYAIRRAVESERERCASLADDEFGSLTVLGDGFYNQLGDAEKTAQNIAAAIRALGGE